MLDAEDVVLVEALPLEPEGAPPDPEVPLDPPDAPVGAEGVVVVGVVVGVVGVVVVGVVVGVVVAEGVVGEVEVEEVELEEVEEVEEVVAVVSVSLVVSDTNSVEPDLVFSRLVLVDDELLCAVLS